MQTFTGDFSLNYVQNLLLIASKSEEKFDFSPSNVPRSMCNINMVSEHQEKESLHGDFLQFELNV